jgi:hypothetical protein
MVLYLFLALGAALCVLAFFRFVTFLSKKRNPLTAADYIGYVERYIRGADRSHEWDDFMTIPLADERLDAVRRQLCELGGGGPPFSEKTMGELRKILAALRSMQGEGEGNV